jgi:DNA/RNA endonuclease YhcR with UshA esterase domain
VKTLPYFLILAAGPAIIAPPVLAHHSLAADYDASKPITLRGTVTKFEWMNPHAHFRMDLKDDSGGVTNWVFELGSPNTLMRSGWNRNSLKVGDEVTVKGCRSKDYTNQGNATSILSRDGRIILSGVSAGENLVAR